MSSSSHIIRSPENGIFQRVNSVKLRSSSHVSKMVVIVLSIPVSHDNNQREEVGFGGGAHVHYMLGKVEGENSPYSFFFSYKNKNISQRPPADFASGPINHN